MTKILQTATTKDEPQISEAERLDILKYVENEDPEGDVLDEAGLKKMIFLFEKRVLKNQEMRIKFPDNPEKFMESEIDLHEALKVTLFILTQNALL